MSVYFIANTRAKAIKIGVAGNPSKRLSELQVGSPESLTLLGVIPGSFPEEGSWHSRWAECRMNGEWFRATDELTSAIASTLVGRYTSRTAPPPPGVKQARWDDFHRFSTIDASILSILRESWRHRVVSVFDPDFCANAVWYGYDGFPGIKSQVVMAVGFCRSDRHPELATMFAYDTVYEVAYAGLPDCQGKCTCVSVLEALLS